MKNRIGIVVLVLLCVGLLLGLVMVNKQATEQKRTDSDTISTLSNKWVDTSSKLDEQKQVTAMLEKDLDAQKKSLLELTNNFVQVSANLTETKGNLGRLEESLKASQAELVKREARIAELETANQQLDKQATDLSSSLTNLTAQIVDTQRKLAASEGDKAFLEKELKRLMAEKAELERQFNDITVLKTQVAKLKEQMNIARRIEWIRQGLFAASEQKGATRLVQGLTVPQTQAKPAVKPVYDLNVEVSADGSVKVVPPGGTNAPASK